MASEPLRYDNVDPAVEARAAELLARMSLAEKIGQLVQVAPLVPDVAETPSEQAGQPGATEPQTQAIPGWKPLPNLDQLIRSGAAGSLLNLASAELVNRYQRIAVKNRASESPC